MTKMFPLQTSRNKNTQPGPTQIPWSIAEKAYGYYAREYGKSQSLERLAERGGFGWCEMDVFYPAWREEASEVHQLRADVDRLRPALYALSGVMQWLNRYGSGKLSPGFMESIKKANDALSLNADSLVAIAGSPPARPDNPENTVSFGIPISAANASKLEELKILLGEESIESTVARLMKNYAKPTIACEDCGKKPATNHLCYRCNVNQMADAQNNPGE